MSHLFALLIAILPAQTADTASPKPATRYVCPPCPVDCHGVTYDKPGRCPRCGMTLREQDSIRNVAILVWDGVELLDFAGPAEVFAAARVGDGGAFNVFTVAPKRRTITSQGFLKIKPNYTIDNCPTPHVLIVPGGGMGPIVNDEKVLAWIKKTSTNTDMILSVCTGAFALAKAGLLNNIEATTWHGAINDLRREAPKTKVRDDRRFVDKGDIITCAGVSAGIDGALHALTKLSGPDVARQAACYMEYDWRPDVPKAERSAVLRKRVASDADGVIDELGQCLAAGTREAAEVLSDADLFGLHEEAKFRELIARHTHRPRATLVTPDEPGEPLVVTGRVLDEAGKPVAAALLYVFHTGKDGVYSTKGGNFGSMGDSLNPRLFGFLRTGHDGRYEFRTIRPGQYPDNGPPAHVHYEVTAHGYERMITEMMFDDDSRMTRRNRRAFEAEGFTLAKPTRGDDGIWRCECDIVITKS
jgi:transcriptional regulator GlxA family with amidase domain/protocatechuate 3,4-dioxygenase beta subunit